MSCLAFLAKVRRSLRRGTTRLLLLALSAIGGLDLWEQTRVGPPAAEEDFEDAVSTGEGGDGARDERRRQGFQGRWRWQAGARAELRFAALERRARRGVRGVVQGAGAA